MSYGPPPRTAYGDQDFIKENNSSQDRPYSPPLAQSFPVQPLSGNNSYQPTGVNLGYNQPSPTGNRAAIIETAQSLTQEDLLLMKSWRRDTFYFKVLPIAIISNGANYYYNHVKGLPQRPLRFFLFSAASYVVGVWFGKSDLQRRINDSPLNTPFTSAMRKYISGSSERFSEFNEATTDSLSANWGTTSDPRELQTPPIASYSSPQSFNKPYKQPNYEFYNQPEVSNYTDRDINPSFNPLHPGIHDTESSNSNSKPVTSYEELRMRNRGYLPPKQM